ncbi:S-layer homology domain-containing protein [Lawsonibacter celer]|uniref:S-layer homology domain-containing protein n=1 Tax=Lawsonibacter celer TaxID=2986526 RepID=UPI0016469A8B|nr:S-layer homology domain-containing protein [Lawsonibacter celer]
MKKRILSMLLAIVMMVGLVPGFTLSVNAAEIVASQPANGDGSAENPYQITTVEELYWFATLVNTKAKDGGNNNAHAKLMNNITVNENVIVDGALTSDTSSLNVWTAMGKSFTSSSWFGGSFDGNAKTISGLYVNETSSYRGFIGYLGEGASVKNLTITDSYFTSTSSTLGAVVGYADLTSVVENCKLTDSVVSGTSSVGGIVGGGDYGEIISNCHVYNCAITGSGDNVGGIAGSAGDYNNEAYIRLCSVNDSSVSGANNVGGILGEGGRLSKTKISACCNYNTTVTATTKNAGGILGSDATCYSCFVTAKVSAPSKQGPFAGNGNNSNSAYDSEVYGEVITYNSSKAFTTEEIKAGVATYYLTDKTASNTVYVLWGQKIGEDNYPSWNPDSNPDYIVYREDDPDAEGGYRYYNGDAAASYEPNEDGIYEIANRTDWYKFAKKAKEDPTIDGVLTDNIDFSAVTSDKIEDYRIGEGDAYTGSFDGDGYTISGLPQMELPLFDTIGSGGELKNLTLSGATVNYISSTPAVGLVENNNGTVSDCAVSDITLIGSTSSAMIGTNRGTVTNCTATNITVEGKSAAAGIVYFNTGTIEKCNVVSGTVKAVHTENYDSHAGGICVRSGAGTIRECSNNADVIAESSSTMIYAAAGIVAAPSDSDGASVQVTKCFNSGDIKGGYAGGISGYDNTSVYVNLSLCYNEGAITGSIAGGIAASGSNDSSDKIINCYNVGAVNATSKAGGIAGDQGNCIIENCHNYAKIVSDNIGAPIVGYSSDVWPGPDELINNHAIEGNVDAPTVSSYLDTKGATSNFDAITVGSTREEFADGTVTAKLNAGNSETVWYQYNDYPILEQRHMHKWAYALDGTNTIKAECVNAGCDLTNNSGGSVTITAPTELVYSGSAMDAECTYDNWVPNKPTIVYNEVDRVNVTGNDITASITLGDATATVDYKIQPREIISSMVTLSKTSVSYNGNKQTVTVTVKYNSSTTLNADTDYEITGITSATDISTGDGYAVTVTGKGNYIGTVTKYWKINKGSLSTQIELEGWEYLDTPNAPSVTNNPENGEVTYTYYVRAGRGYNPTGSDHGAQTEGGVPSYVGTYYVGAVIAETEHYLETTINIRQYKMFEISSREVNNPTFEGLQATYPYDNGNEIKPAFTLKDDLGNVIPESEYTVAYTNNTAVGEATITVTDNDGGNYTVSGSATFTIATHSHEWMYELDGTDTIKATCTADGCTNTDGGSIKITANNSTYTPNTPHAANLTDANGGDAVVIGDLTELPTIQYQKKSGEGWENATTITPTDAGTYKASITVDGVTASVDYTISPLTITGALVGAFETMTYNGGAQTPSAVVTIDGLTAEGRWSQVTNVTDTTTFTASGNFTGKIENQNPGMQKLFLNGATITLESDSLIYNGSAQSVTITSVKVGDVVVPTDAYSVSSNSGTEVGSYTLTITANANENTNFTGSATKGFTINQSGSVIGDDSIKTYRGETETTAFTYGDVITVKAQVAPTGEAPITFALMPNQMALFYGDTQICEAVEAVNGVYTMTYNTAGKDLPVGTRTLTVKYVGNGNMADTEKSVDVTLNKKPLTVVSAVSDGRVYEKNNTSVTITGVTISGKALDTDAVSVDTTDLTGSLASDNAGTYTKVTLPALTLTGDHKDYYIISGGEVDTNVAIAQITGTTSVNASPVTYSDISAKTQDLADVVASFKNGTEDLTYTVASKSSEIASASMDGSQLTFNLASGLTDAGTAAITVDVTGFTNYSKVTVTVDIELTDKTIVTVDMSDIVLVNRDFNGEALTYTGEAKADGYTGAFTYTWQDAEGNALTEAPTDAGTYRLVASVSDTVFYAGSNYVTVTIAPKEVTVTALDKSAYVGSTAPDLSVPVAGKDYTISGLVDDTVVTVTLSCTPDMSKAGEYAITSSASEESGNYTFTYVNGKLTVTYIPYIPSTPSAPTTQKVTVPISSDEETIHVDTKVKGDTATIDHVNLDHLDTVIGDHVEEIGTVTIDFSVLDKPITTVEIPANAVKEIADAVNDPHNDAHSFEVILTDGTSIDFDAEAMAEMAVQADGNDITISIVSHEDAKLTSAQEYVVGDHVAFDINVTSGGEHISDMGGKITVHAPYELQDGEHPRGIVVWYVDEDGKRERCETSYDAENKRVNWKTDHLSLYMIDYDASLAESCDGVTNCPSRAFTDLDTSLWYHEATDYVLENGLMNGVGNNLFDPNGTTSRAMIVTILWRLEGEPVVNYLMQFEDVAAETWYTEAVRWAASEGIVTGYSDVAFGPNDPITREQLATILYRYEQHKGGGFTGAWMFLLDYTDRDEVSDWAYEAMCWTTMHGVINGKGDGILDPKGNAKRCEAAQMLTNYLDK